LAVIVRLPGCYPVAVSLNLAHWRPNGTHHVKSNPALAAVSVVKLGVGKPSSGRRLWLYVRGGYALHVDLVVDRRPLVKCRGCGRMRLAA
jgi:hypothetical protein